MRDARRASPLLFLSNWLAALLAVLLITPHRSRQHELEPLLSASVVVPSPHLICSSTPRARSAEPVNYWYPRLAIIQLLERPFPRLLEKIGTSKTAVSMEASPFVSPPITMLSIRAGIDPNGSTLTNSLAIQCRTSMAVSNARQSVIAVHGLVTQDVVSSSGKILVMAGSRVVGRVAVDMENGRLKSTGLWSVFCDSTEIKVHAQILDGLSGMAGILGQKASNEDEALQREAFVRDGQYVFLPDKTCFILEAYGDISLRDVESKATSD
jgi:hypothetical protein